MDEGRLENDFLLPEDRTVERVDLLESKTEQLLQFINKMLILDDSHTEKFKEDTDFQKFMDGEYRSEGEEE